MAIDHLSATFAALADPTRRAILARLASGECTVTELAEPFQMSMPAVSKHLRVLERAGLIAQRRDAQRRPCRIDAAPLKDVAVWAERYRHIWEQRLDRLDAYLQDLQASALPTIATTSTKSSKSSKTTTSPKETRHARKPRS